MENKQSLSAVLSNPVSEALSNQTSLPTEQDTLDDAFKYDSYQVVRGEFFSHIYEPSISFNNCKVYLNTACLKKLPEVDYVQILINPEEKKLAVLL